MSNENRLLSFTGRDLFPFSAIKVGLAAKFGLLECTFLKSKKTSLTNEAYYFVWGSTFAKNFE